MTGFQGLKGRWVTSILLWVSTRRVWFCSQGGTVRSSARAWAWTETCRSILLIPTFKHSIARSLPASCESSIPSISPCLLRTHRLKTRCGRLPYPTRDGGGSRKHPSCCNTSSGLRLCSRWVWLTKSGVGKKLDLVLEDLVAWPFDVQCRAPAILFWFGSAMYGNARWRFGYHVFVESSWGGGIYPPSRAV